MELVNETSLVVDRSAYFDARGAEQMVFAAKASFALKSQSSLEPAAEPVPLSPAEIFYGEPGASSLRAEAELGPKKLATDCILRGHAHAAKGGDTKSYVRFSVGTVSRTAVVFGRRRWLGKSSPVASEPEKFDRLALRWEHAFGGGDETPEDPEKRAWQRDNPVGVGLIAEQSRRDLEREELPRIEDPSSLVTSPWSRPSPVGFGFIARHWAPRAAFAGTYDAVWQRERMPLLPADFDPRHHQAAPPALVAPRLRGGERLSAEGVSPAGPIQLLLPRAFVSVLVTSRDGEQRVDLELDTVLLDADAMVLTLLLKGELAVHGALDDVEQTRFEGEVRT